MMKVAIMRPKEYLRETEDMFASAGFDVVSVPFLKIEEEILEPDNFHFEYVIITSQTAAKIILKNSELLKRIKKAKIISIGSSTARILENAGLKTVTPTKYDSSTLYHEFKRELEGEKVAIFRSDKGDPLLLGLSEVAEVKEYVLYTIQFEHGEEQIDFLKRLVEGEFDSIIFSSRMMVRSFFELAEKIGEVDRVKRALEEMLVIAIGPPTKRELESLGVEPMMPKRYTFSGILEILNDCFR